ncbi:hypothetical protein Tco_1502052 [Tanacetum coccineum]
MSFIKHEFLKKAKSVNPRLYDIGCYNDNLALMLAPETDEMIRLAQESRSKLSDLIKPFYYKNLNNLYETFVPQRNKSAEQKYFLNNLVGAARSSSAHMFLLGILLGWGGRGSDILSGTSCRRLGGQEDCIRLLTVVWDVSWVLWGVWCGLLNCGVGEKCLRFDDQGRQTKSASSSLFLCLKEITFRSELRRIFQVQNVFADNLHGIGIWMVESGIKSEKCYFVYNTVSENDVWVQTKDGEPFVASAERKLQKDSATSHLYNDVVYARSEALKEVHTNEFATKEFVMMEVDMKECDMRAS